MSSRTWLLRGALLCAALSARAAGAQPGTFESFPAGTRITTQVPGANFRSFAEVFQPTRVTTGGRNAVRGCAGCMELRIDFAPAVGAVSLAVGMDAEACNNDQCFDTAARLQAFDAAGNLLSSTPPLHFSGLMHIVHYLRVSDAGQRITSVRVAYTNLGMGGAGRVSIDNLQFSAAAGAPGPAAAPPVVRFREPADNALVLTAPWVRGQVEAPAGVLAMCVAVNNPALDAATCGGEGQNFIPAGATAADFNLPPMRELHAGGNTVTVAVRDNQGRSTRETLRIRLSDAASGIDFAARALLVTQGVQRDPQPGSGNVALRDGTGSGPRAAYNGVVLARGARTAVRFFAQAQSRGELGSGVALSPRALLYGYVDAGHAGGGLGPDRGEVLGAALPGSPLSPDAVPTLSGTRTLAAEVADPAGGYQFTLPDAWTRGGAIILQAEVNPAGAGSLGEADRSNNGFQLETVEFRDPHPPIQIDAIALTYNGAPGGFGNYATVPDPWAAFQGYRRLLPMRIDVPGYRMILDITSIVSAPTDFDTQSGQIISLLGRYNNVGTSNRYVMGLTETSRQSSLPIQGLGQGFLWGHGVAYVAPSRPLTSVAHESFHLLGFSHAGNNCPGVAGSGGIEGWPAGDMGNLLGNGLDVNGVLGPVRGRYRTVVDGTAGVSSWFDFMSYCANPNESDAWISTRYWNRLLGGPDISSALAPQPGAGVHVGGSLAAARTALGGAALEQLRGTGAAPAAVPPPGADETLRVYAWELEGKAEIWRVEGGHGQPTQPDAKSPYHVVVRDATGAVLSDTPVPAAQLLLHHPTSRHFFAVEVPGAGAALVQLVYAGACPVSANGTACVLAERKRGSTPVVTVLAPVAGSTQSGAVAVSWSVAGLGPGETTTAEVDYSPDNGASWRAVAGNLPGSKAELPAALFAGSKAARVRVTVNSGFAEGVAVSEAFAVQGAPPRVHLDEPTAGSVIWAGTLLFPSGAAYDDAGQALEDKQLQWFDGDTLLGVGERPGSFALPAGVHQLSLVATDAAGRSSRASARLEVRAAPLTRSPARAGPTPAVPTKP